MFQVCGARPLAGESLPFLAWWARLVGCAFTRINMKLTIPKNQFEDVRQSWARSCSQMNVLRPDVRSANHAWEVSLTRSRVGGVGKSYGRSSRRIASAHALRLNRTLVRRRLVARCRQTQAAAIGQLRVAGGSMQSPHVDAVRPTRAVWPTARPRTRSDRLLGPTAA
jgi:hypothetical protein